MSLKNWSRFTILILGLAAGCSTAPSALGSANTPDQSQEDISEIRLELSEAKASLETAKDLVNQHFSWLVAIFGVLGFGSFIWSVKLSREDIHNEVERVAEGIRVTFNTKQEEFARSINKLKEELVFQKTEISISHGQANRSLAYLFENKGEWDTAFVWAMRAVEEFKDGKVVPASLSSSVWRAKRCLEKLTGKLDLNEEQIKEIRGILMRIDDQEYKSEKDQLEALFEKKLKEATT